MYQEKNIVRLDVEQMMMIGNRIQDARKAKNMSSIDLADCIGVGKDQMSRIENGKVQCKLEYIFVLTQYLDVSADFLLYGRKKQNEREAVTNILDELNPRDFNRAKNILKAAFE